ncbi:putative high affinity copper protein [Camillea tinctor]|nr:putative high affinity copper protein [Camillea tinctor]
MDGISTATASPTVIGATPSSTGHGTFAFTPPGANWTPKPTPTLSSGMGNGAMESMNMEGNCRISMLWNWHTIDACFLSESWQVKSSGGFAALCLGVIMMVMLLEFLRGAAKSYDRHLIRQHVREIKNKHSSGDAADGALIAKGHPPLVPTPPCRPSVLQQLVRALFHTVQFALAYWIMLLAMYYNGYIIICIIIGAFLGSFVFQWEQLGYR